MDITKTIKIANFNLSVFGNLLNQSLSVSPQLMIEFNEGMIKSCSFSSTKSFIKLWTIPLKSLLLQDAKVADDASIIDMFPEETVAVVEEEIHNFNFYILKGDLFRKYISVHNQANVDLEFSLKLIEDKYQAYSITITGKSETGSPLKTTFILTTEELITNKISDYSAILAACTPTPDMIEIFLTDKQIQETKGLIKKLHKSSVDNSAYLTFTVENNKIKINDKVFNIEFDVDLELKEKNAALNNKSLEPNEQLSFNILKSDFIITGDHTFSFFTSDDSEKVIIVGKYGGSVIWCLTTKISEHSNSDMDNSDDTLDALNLSEYGLDDDLPF